MASRAEVQVDHGPPVTNLFDGVAPDVESTFAEPYD